MNPHYYILPVDCRVAMREFMAPKSVHTVVTSPPYFGLRDYGTDGQLGLEPTPDDFVAALVEVFREIRRVLRDDGTVWLNLGDSYNNYRPGNYSDNRAHSFGSERTDDKKRGMPDNPSHGKRGNKIDALKEKDLIGIPWRVAFALQADGWYLRQDIIWEKPNPMPESVRDRCTKAHEYIFMLTKRPKYYFDAEAIKEPVQSDRAPSRKAKMSGAGRTGVRTEGKPYDGTGATRNKRSVWRVSTKPFKGAHFATFPIDLIEPCILAGCPEQCCASCGAPWVAVVERSVSLESNSALAGNTPAGKCVDEPQSKSGEYDIRMGPVVTSRVTGHKPTCTCDAGVTTGTVFDPFGGAGTTAVAALKHGRNAILSEINQEYIAMAHKRIEASIK